MTDDEPPAPDAPPAPSARPRLWNPDAAANWSLLFTPIFGALLQAANWRALGKPARAKVNVAWVWAGVAFLAVNFASVLLPESATTDKVLRFGGLGLLVSWYFGQGRPQARYVKEAYGGDYERRGWGVPLLCAVAGTLAYFGLAVAAFAALAVLRPTTAADLIEQVKPQLLAEWRKSPASRDASIQAIALPDRDGDTYTGTVDATVAGRPQKYALKVVNGSTELTWQVEPVTPDLGQLIPYKSDRLYYTTMVNAAEATRLGDYLAREGFFDGQARVVQLTKTGRTYEVRFPLKEGLERDPDTVNVLEDFAGQISEAVFNSAPTDVHLCDENFATLRVVTAK